MVKNLILISLLSSVVLLFGHSKSTDIAETGWMHHGMNFGFANPTLHFISWFGFAIGLIILLLIIAKHLRRKQPLAILKNRFAAGEITQEEFEQMRSVIIEDDLNKNKLRS
jgi:uncharacterized membrane protein